MSALKVKIKDYYTLVDKIVSVDRYPDKCPFCHKAIVAAFLEGLYFSEFRTAQLVFYCSNHSCQSLFIGYYSIYPSGVYELTGISTGKMIGSNYTDLIKEISPDFTTIHSQAFHAEQINLLEICGVGYRKALEFLIKDYIIYKDSSIKEDVEKKFLGKCIDDHIDNEKIKKVAKRATWLANDETHYVKKWEGKNLQDLKVLIELTLHWIEMEELTNKFVNDMPE